MDDMFSSGTQKKQIQIEDKEETGNQKEKNYKNEQSEALELLKQGVRNLNVEVSDYISERQERSVLVVGTMAKIVVSLSDAQMDCCFPFPLNLVG